MSDTSFTLAHWGTYRTEMQDGELVALRALDDDPDPSPIAGSFPAVLSDEARIARPMVRAGYLEKGPESRNQRGAEPFVEVSWNKAITLAAQELDRVRRKFGNKAIFGGSYGWASAGRFHHAQSQLHRFLNVCGGYTRSVNTHSYAAAEVVLPHLIGSQAGLAEKHTPWELIHQNTTLFVAFGGLPAKNTQISSGGVRRHKVSEWLRKCLKDGTQFVSISPIYSDTAAELDHDWLAIRPNTDTALMLALCHELASTGLADEAFLKRYTVGYDKVRAYLVGSTDGQPKTPDWAAGICGIDADRIRALAHQMAHNRTMIAVAWSLQRAENGEQPIWAAVTLAAMLGQIGLPGGGIGFGYGGANRVGNIEPGISWPALPQGTNAVPDFIPVARLADMLLNPGAEFAYNGRQYTYPDTRLVWWAGGNPFHHQQDLNKLVRAWRSPDTVIVHEPWWTATARHADIVLPCTTTLERNDFGIAKGESALIAMQCATQPFGGARCDYDILSAIASKLGLAEPFTEGRSEMDWVRHLYEQARETAGESGHALPPFDAFWQAGEAQFAVAQAPKNMLEDFRKAPEKYRLNTPSGRIEIASSRVADFGYDECPGYAVWIEPQEWLGADQAAEYPLHLVSNQPVKRLHSQLDNGSLSRASKVAGREPATFNPVDAAALNIRAGDIVRLTSPRGACLVGAVISDHVARHVVQLSTGAWFAPEVQGQVGALDLHGNPNVLTQDKGTSRLAQGPVAHSTLVNAERMDIPQPEVTCFRPPKIIPAADYSHDLTT